MDIVIREIDGHSIQNVNQCDGTFIVDSKLDLQVQNGKAGYTIVPVPPYEKRYLPDETDYGRYVNNLDRVIFFAYINNELAGQIRVVNYWNGFAYINDLVVDVKHRKQGIGRLLILQAINWAKEKNFPGLMLETQNNNVAACRLYERCGFELSGFDRNLYKGLTPETDEVALYWYLIF